jgi:hypothetical protein
MGVSLDYRTTVAVPRRVKDAVEAEAHQLLPPHGWWAEGLNFFDSGEADGRLYGSTKIFLLFYPIPGGGYAEVDPDEDSLMAYRDTCFILDRLAEWARKHGVGWELECAGEPIGTISRGQCDAQLSEYVAGMKDSFPWPAAYEEQVREIAAKHAGRCASG